MRRLWQSLMVGVKISPRHAVHDNHSRFFHRSLAQAFQADAPVLWYQGSGEFTNFRATCRFGIGPDGFASHANHHRHSHRIHGRQNHGRRAYQLPSRHWGALWVDCRALLLYQELRSGAEPLGFLILTHPFPQLASPMQIRGTSWIQRGGRCDRMAPSSSAGFYRPLTSNQFKPTEIWNKHWDKVGKMHYTEGAR